MGLMSKVGCGGVVVVVGVTLTIIIKVAGPMKLQMK